ncbi:outer membrane beta-barrel family protein [Chryseobacterium sp. BIGb0232]|uniref:outer membrane beta-barrel family protein n=2 Tax=Chryseobacterium TaxID=59732 RepID=UPI000F4A7602|nr:outer membrane beta-barrel family protein [Chryseobacterium sp. BIGb0232]MCS4302934.1 outer membrane receptor protein involved in Fe transport [Chryseobacterium sp. BIGb0232]ROS14774.1 outer membrane receptor protein involved in Fe transport [Chryseobacterium nakagawai]
MKTQILIAALFFSGLVSAQQKKDSLKVNAIESVNIKKQVFKKQGDRLVYDVAASPIAKGTNTFNLLKQTPMISSIDGKTLKILGKSDAVIYINNKKTNMDSEALIEMLKSTPSEDIQKIEVITVPGSEFQVESKEGVINIVMKKNKNNGYNGTLKMQNEQAYYNNPSAGASFNFRQGKWSGNSNFRMGSWTERQRYTLSNGDPTFRNESYGSNDDPNKNFGGGFNVDYEISKNQSLGLSYNMRYNKSFNSILDMTNWQNGILMDRTVNHEDAQTRNHSFNLNYEIKTDSLGSKLTSNVSYLWFNRDKASFNESIPFGIDPSSEDYKKRYSALQQSVPQIINNYAANIDYLKKTSKGATWLMGVSYNYTNTDNDTRQDKLIDGEFVMDSKQTNHFIYKENILGIYLNYERKLTEKLSGKIGARYEMTRSTGDILGKTGFERNYNNLLPYLNLNYAINSDHNLSYTFSSRIRRPRFWELNPSRTYFTPTNYTQNNPFVMAAKFYNQELNYMYKNAFYANLNYTMVDDAAASDLLPLQGILTTPQTDKNGNIIYGPNGDMLMQKIKFLRYIRTNYGKNREISLTLGMNKSWFKDIWTTNYSVNLGYIVYTGGVWQDPTSQLGPYESEELEPYIVDVKNYNMSATLNNIIRLSSKKDWFLGVNYYFGSKVAMEGGTIGVRQSLDINVKKIIGDWTVVAEVNDLFNQSFYSVNGIQPNGKYNNITNFNYPRVFSIGVTYNFGNQKLKKAREMKSANDAVKSRT